MSTRIVNTMSSEDEKVQAVIREIAAKSGECQIIYAEHMQMRRKTLQVGTWYEGEADQEFAAPEYMPKSGIRFYNLIGRFVKGV